MNLINITIDIEFNHQSQIKLLLKRAFPEMNLCDENIVLIAFELGLTNILYKGEITKGNEKLNVMVRIYGNNTDILVNREVEYKIISILGKKGISSKLYTRFNNGIIVEFIEGRNLEPSTIKEEKIFKLIAKQLAELHKLEMVDDFRIEDDYFFTQLTNYYHQAREAFPDYQLELPLEDNNENSIVDLDRLKADMDDVLSSFRNSSYKLVYCHNDLNAENCIYDPKTEKLTFIDFEYFCKSYRGADISNHFCEYAGVVTNLDFDNCYPSKEHQCEFIRAYLSSYLEKSEEEVTEEEIEELYNEVDHCRILSNIKWGIWGLIQESMSSLDFDFKQYANGRLIEFYKILSDKEK
eukprot:TRINITY_DN6255_c0_g1_i1.p1 TRINITY_DN6255_c0_g1~~TRINITY_DN6255_c0_g1_i1.p1  ORF type:complete len:352 (+),score=77.35 TRINITY_DN6255_c0_g1_i1:45-1100(+)